MLPTVEQETLGKAEDILQEPASFLEIWHSEYAAAEVTILNQRSPR
ncbi:MAG TPA: hypothetical protein V6C57_11495 [Coleofasciculaceae cyanobacterium]